jgi:hypothetical protein
MRRRNVIVLVRVLSWCLLAACSADSALAADPPVRADYLGSRDGKPPLKFHSVRLTLVNQHDKPVWFVLPYWGDEPLPEKGVFPNKDLKEQQPFEGDQFDGEGGSAVEVLMLGGFKAFRLPAKGQLELDGYTIEAWKDIEEIVVIEARELKVNGKTPLEKWLPYGTTSGEKVKVVGSETVNNAWKSLDWDDKRLGSREDYPKEKVEEVKAEGFRSWTVRLQKKAEKKSP